MSKNERERDASSESRLIDKLSEIISNGVSRLPNSSGDLLNFLADAVAAITLGFLWKTGILPKEQVLWSFGFLLTFLLLCFMGSLLMKRVDRSERPQ